MTPFATSPTLPSRSTHGLWPARRPFAAIDPVLTPSSHSRPAGSQATTSDVRFAVVLAAVCAALVLPGSALARECGIPDANPLWVDFAGHDAPLPQKPGLTLAFTSGTVKPSEARAAGAATVFFDLNFNNRVGTPTLPADPATIADAGGPPLRLRRHRDRLHDTVDRAERALRSADADALDGDDGAVPREHARSRQAARRARREAVRDDRQPALHRRRGGAVVARPRLVAVLIRQVFFTSPNVPQLHALGPVRASRAMRTGMRALVRRFTEIGIPASRVALELQFQSAAGTGGREGLQPRSKWLEIVKLQALAVRQVTKELRTHSIWSWGWATFSEAGIDKDKGEAVCVYLWVRDPQLCSGPGAAGPAMDASLTVGQLDQLGRA